ncbi:MAG: MAPEG family protein [Bradyrhizobium sp.]
MVTRVGEAMTVAEWCVFAALILSLLTIAPIKWLGYRQFDNARPRDGAFYQDPLRARALGAHQNGLEAFPFFAIAVLLAEFRGAPQSLVDELAALFLIVRIAYVLTYLGDRPTLRSIMWIIGFAINIATFFLSLIRSYLPA